MDRQIIITSGDPAGVGPEITCRALAELGAQALASVTVIGDATVLEQAARITGSAIRFGEKGGEGRVRLIDVPLERPVAPGRLDPAAGDAAYRAIVRGVDLALEEGGCIVTAPINKEAMNLAGHAFDGHTGLLAHLTGSASSFMLLASEKLSTIHVSTHVSLGDAIGRVRPERVLATIEAGWRHFRRLGIESPRIAVAGLNPHCGEHGLFGAEDDRFIAPAVASARAQGIDATGPISPDTVFYRATQGEFDLVVAQYHDQGHIPTKLIAFDETVNISLGLPIDRTSVDHGTAFDIAGTGRASHRNMMAAIAYARRLPPPGAMQAQEIVA